MHANEGLSDDELHHTAEDIASIRQLYHGSATLPPRLKDLTGQRFGHMVVQYWAGRNMDGAPIWLCRCDFGANHLVKGADVQRAKRCSCQIIEEDRIRIDRLAAEFWARPNPIADTILTALRDRRPEGMSRTDLHNLFDGHQSSTEITAALHQLLVQGRARSERNRTKGRPSETWFAVRGTDE